MSWFDRFLNNPLYIRVSIEGIHARALVDTGADHNLISMSTITALDMQTQIDQRDTIVYGGVCGDPQQSIGKIFLRLFISKELEILTEFDVVQDPVGIPYLLILGRTFLTANRCIINFIKDNIQINSVDIPFLALMQAELLTEPNSQRKRTFINYIEQLRGQLTQNQLCVFIRIIDDIIKAMRQGEMPLPLNKNAVSIRDISGTQAGLNFIQSLGYITTTEKPNHFTLARYDPNDIGLLTVIRDAIKRLHNCP